MPEYHTPAARTTPSAPATLDAPAPDPRLIADAWDCMFCNRLTDPGSAICDVCADELEVPTWMR
jgi:hypothetical protein